MRRSSKTSDTDVQKEILCSRFIVLDSKCSCTRQNDCPGEGYACFGSWWNLSYQPLCAMNTVVDSTCACSIDDTPGRLAVPVFKRGICGNSSQTTCPDDCFHCRDASHCQICNYGFYVNNSKCLKCPSNCRICSNSNTCTECQLSYELVDGKCKKCEYRSTVLNICEKVDVLDCPNSQKFDHELLKCVDCVVANCAVCNDESNVCQECFNGSEMQTECPACDPQKGCQCVSVYGLSQHCASCNKLNDFDGGCLSCISGYHLDMFGGCLKTPTEDKGGLSSGYVALIIVSSFMSLCIIVGVILYLDQKRKNMEDPKSKFVMFFKEPSAII